MNEVEGLIDQRGVVRVPKTRWQTGPLGRFYGRFYSKDGTILSVLNEIDVVHLEAF